jgi:hypothetical protein
MRKSKKLSRIINTFNPDFSENEEEKQQLSFHRSHNTSSLPPSALTYSFKFHEFTDGRKNMLTLPN